jgi:hypothetical protein
MLQPGICTGRRQIARSQSPLATLNNGNYQLGLFLLTYFFPTQWRDKTFLP